MKKNAKQARIRFPPQGFIERYALFTRRGEEPRASRQPAIRAAVIRSNFERKQSKHSSRVDCVVWGAASDGSSCSRTDRVACRLS